MCIYFRKSFYDNYEIINYIIDSLKIIYNISDKLELFLTENENHILKIKYITKMIKIIA